MPGLTVMNIIEQERRQAARMQGSLAAVPHKEHPPHTKAGACSPPRGTSSASRFRRRIAGAACLPQDVTGPGGGAVAATTPSQRPTEAGIVHLSSADNDN